MEKKKKRYRKNYLLLNLIIAMVLCACLVYWAGTDTFKVRTILTEGNSHYTTGEIVKIGGIEPGLNIFSFPSKKIKENLLKDPYIRDVAVSRKLPGKVIINVLESREAASVAFGEKFVIIDDEGMVLRVAGEKPEITLIDGITLTNIKAGTELEAEETTLFKGALGLLSSMEDHDLFFKRIHVSDSIIRAYVYDELYCEGRPDNILKSMDDLKDVLYDLYVKGIERGIVKVGGSGYISYSAVIE